MRFGTVALVGRSNVGKSTFLNAALGEHLAIVSPQPQTTRDALLGVVNLPQAQIAFLDTPGLHRPQTELGRRMNQAALDAARAADLLVFVTDDLGVRPPSRRLLPSDAEGKSRGPLLPEDEALLRLLPPDAPAILAINKVDLIRKKETLLPVLEAFHGVRNWQALVPVSLRNGDDVATLLREIAETLPEGDAGYDTDTLTNQPVVFFVREYVREQVLLAAGREVPHAVAVSIDKVEETATQLAAKVTLHVEKVGQRKILVGAGGQQIKAIGMAARERIAELIGKTTHLELFVRVTPRWKEVPRQLAELGYDVGELAHGDAEAELARLTGGTGARRAPAKKGPTRKASGDTRKKAPAKSAPATKGTDAGKKKAPAKNAPAPGKQKAPAKSAPAPGKQKAPAKGATPGKKKAPARGATPGKKKAPARGAARPKAPTSHRSAGRGSRS